MTKLNHVERVRARYSDTDAQGIAHHSNFFRWLEEARLAWLRHIGHPYAELTSRDLYIPLTACFCDFHAAVQAEDWLDVCLYITEASRVRAGFFYEVFCGSKKVATATTRHAYVDRTGCPVRLAPDDPFFLAVRSEADKVPTKSEKAIEQGQMAKDAYEIFIGRVRDGKRRSHE